MQTPKFILPRAVIHMIWAGYLMASFSAPSDALAYVEREVLLGNEDTIIHIDGNEARAADFLTRAHAFHWTSRMSVYGFVPAE